MSNRTGLALELAGGAALLAGIAVGVAAIPTSMLRTREAPIVPEDSPRPAIARDSGPITSVPVDDTRSMSAESEEADPYAAYRYCRELTPAPSVSPQVTVFDPSAPKSSPQAQSKPSQPND